MVILILAFGARGLMTGLISQVFGVLGLVAGLWTAGWVSQRVGAHWSGAQPAVAFLLLRVLVVAGSALAVAALFRWLGELLRAATHATPAAWVDRPAGFLLGVAVGTFVATFVLLIALMVPWPRGLAETAAHSRVARPTMSQAARACSAGERFFPGTDWLERRFVAAERRAERLRTS